MKNFDGRIAPVIMAIAMIVGLAIAISFKSQSQSEPTVEEQVSRFSGTLQRQDTLRLNTSRSRDVAKRFITAADRPSTDSANSN